MGEIKKLVYDVETDGFYNEATVIHCIVVQDYETGLINVYHDYEGKFKPYSGTIEQGVKVLNEADVVIAHNQCGFDIRVLKKLNFTYKPKDGQVVIDSLALSRMLYPEMKKHSIEAWAKKLKLPQQKVQNSDWIQLTQNMLERCISDVEINLAVINHLWHIVDDNESESDTQWLQGLMLEQDVLALHSKQVEHGVLYDSTMAEKLLVVLDGKLLSLKDKIIKGAPPVMKVPGITSVALNELREVADWAFVKQHNLYQGTTKIFRVVNHIQVKRPFKKDGSLTKQALRYVSDQDNVRGSFSSFSGVPSDIEDRYLKNIIDWFTADGSDESIVQTVKGSFSKVEFNPININSDVQVKNLLYSLGWVPDEWNSKRMPDGAFKRTSAKLSESSFGSLPQGLGQDVKLYYTLKHRRSSIQSITDPENKGALAKVRKRDGRVPAEAITCGTPTARYRHSGA
jgi:hypothetical protein